MDQWLDFVANELAPVRAMLLYPMTPEGKALHDAQAAKVQSEDCACPALTQWVPRPLSPNFRNYWLFLTSTSAQEHSWYVETLYQ
mgnify:CR=1 FL=1